MQAAAASRSGAPTRPVRGTGLLLASLTCAAVMLLLMLGLSIRLANESRPAPALIAWIPEPEPSPEPPRVPKPSPSAVARLHAKAHATKPETVPQPDARSGAMPAPVAPPIPAPLPAPAAAASPLDGNGNGSSGTGTGAGQGGDGKGGGAGGGGGSGFVAASWVVVPGTPELEPYNPPAARRERVNGRVLLSCHVLRSQRVRGCRVVDERPRGYGFGYAALAAAQSFRLNPPTRDGTALEDLRVEIPVAFNNRRPQ